MASVELRFSGSDGRFERNAVDRNFYSPHRYGFIGDIMAAVATAQLTLDSGENRDDQQDDHTHEGSGQKLERFPEYPPRDDMQNWLHLYEPSVITSLAFYYADEPNVTVASEVPVTPTSPVREDVRIPDLLFVRDADRELMEEQRGYVIDRQGKAPDFVLEVASPTTGRADYTDKRSDYERFRYR